MVHCLKHRLLRFLVTMVVVCLWSAQLSYGQDVSQEYRLKAAFLTNFIRFISWPDEDMPNQRKEVILCVFGENPFGDALRRVEGKLLNNRKLRVVETTSIHDIPDCHLLFVSKSQKMHLQEVMHHIQHQPVVSVSDMAEFVTAGGGIEFVMVKQDRLSFIINRTDLMQRKLQIRSQMLELAQSLY